MWYPTRDKQDIERGWLGSDLPELAANAVQNDAPNADELVQAAEAYYHLVDATRALDMIPTLFTTRDADVRWCEAHAPAYASDHALFAIMSELYDRHVNGGPRSLQ